MAFNKFQTWIMTGIISLSIISTTQVFSARCGEVKIVEMNWALGALFANIDNIILKSVFGCDSELVTDDTLPTFITMVECGTPYIAPEIWENAYRERLNKAVEEGKLYGSNNAPFASAGSSVFVSEAFYKAHSELKIYGGCSKLS